MFSNLFDRTIRSDLVYKASKKDMQAITTEKKTSKKDMQAINTEKSTRQEQETSL